MNKIKKAIYAMIVSMGLLIFTDCLEMTVYAEGIQLGESKIHFINIPGNNDAILLESNGKFAMVDSGEDTDYPDGSDFRYPLRPGIVIDGGSEQQVIAYMKSVGVTQDNFELYIGSHAHSDHIGAADEIIREFSPKKVYLARYDDSYIQKDRGLWDNQYVHDNAVIAAYETGAVLVQYFDPSYPTDTYQYVEKEMLLNLEENDVRICDELYDRETALDIRDEDNVYQGQCIYTPYTKAMGASYGMEVLEEALKSAQTGSTKLTVGDMQLELFNYEGNWDKEPIYDANGMSLCVKVTLDGNTVFLGGDLDSEGEKKIGDYIGDIDIMKASHHGFSSSNSLEFMEKIMPEITVITGSYTGIIESNYEQMQLTDYRLYTTDQYRNLVDAVVINLENLNTNVKDFPPFFIKTISSPYTLFHDGRRITADGIVSVNGELYFFNNSPHASVAGWNQYNGNMYYSGKDGRLVAGWILHENEWYYTNEEYVMQTGLQIINGIKYYFDETTGVLLEQHTPGWEYKDGEWYYYSENGNKVKGWGKISGIQYYFNKKGVMAVDWQYIDGKWYYFSESGAMTTGWNYVRGAWYYLDSEGVMQTGLQKINGQTYYLINSGGMAVDWQYIEGKWYYFSGSGAMTTGWNYVRGAWYYLDSEGVMQTGLQKINGQTYYLTNSGAMAVDWQYIEGKWYYFSGSGAMTTGWNYVRGAWYYLDGEGVMQTGWQEINGQIYYLTNSGAMAVGWQYIDGRWYYFLESGSMTTGWNCVRGVWYYLDGEGVMQTGWQEINGQTYYLTNSGAMAVGWQYIDGEWYYFTENGSRATGWKYLGNFWYYLNSDGIMVSTPQIIDGVFYVFNSSGQWIG